MLKTLIITMHSKRKQKHLLKGYNMLLYFAGSMIMYEPTEECITDFWSNGILKNLPVSSANPNFVKAASQLRESYQDKTTFGTSIRNDFIKLFSGNDNPLAPAFEKLYSENPGIRAEEDKDVVTVFYDSYGWNSGLRSKKGDDHLGIEMLFLAALIDQYLVLDDHASEAEMGSEIRRFITLHMLSWIPAWNNKVQKNAATLAYKGIGSLIFACVEDIYNIFG
jgi:putative dimethyl sulfoxide reductase chaperone